MKAKSIRKSVLDRLNRGSFVKLFPSHVRTEYTLVYPGSPCTKRVSRSFADFEKAKRDRDRVLAEFKNHDARALLLPPSNDSKRRQGRFKDGEYTSNGEQTLPGSCDHPSSRRILGHPAT